MKVLVVVHHRKVVNSTSQLHRATEIQSVGHSTQINNKLVAQSYCIGIRASVRHRIFNERLRPSRSGQELRPLKPSALARTSCGVVKTSADAKRTHRNLIISHTQVSALSLEEIGGKLARFLRSHGRKPSTDD